jgi:hypothetical protein
MNFYRFPLSAYTATYQPLPLPATDLFWLVNLFTGRGTVGYGKVLYWFLRGKNVGKHGARALEPTYMLRVLKCKHTHTDTYIYTTPTLLY